MLSPNKKLQIVLFISAVFLTGLITLIFLQNTYRFKINLVKNPIPNETVSKVFFRDLNNNGYSERIKIYNQREQEDTFHINVYEDSKKLINQWNFRDSILTPYLSFHDLDGDNIEELLVWTQGRDSLFLSIINWQKEQKDGVNNFFVMKREQVNDVENWDIKNLTTQYSAKKPDFLFFTLTSGYAEYPRGIFSFNLKNRQLSKDFIVNASIRQSELYDINKDGLDEIIIATAATKNFDKSVIYSDSYSWVLIFNLDLEILFEKKFENPFGATVIVPDTSNYPPMIYAFVTNNDKNTNILKINEEFRTIYEKFFPDFTPVFYKTGNNSLSIFFNGWEKSKFVKINKKNSIIDSLLFDYEIKPKEIGDIDNDGYINYYTQGYNKFILLDEKYRTIALFNLSENEEVYDVSIKITNDVKPQLSINTNKNSYLCTFVPSFFHKWFLGLIFILFVLNYSFFFSIHLLINKISIYISYFLFTLRRSDNAIILLNGKNIVINFNQKVNEIFDLDEAIKRKDDFRKALQKYNEIISIIEESIKDNKRIKQNIAFDTAKNSLFATISVTPFFTYFKLVNAYLIEIQDSTAQVIAERRINWQRNLRRMIHDIKNPLAGVQLKLQTLYMKILDQNPELAGQLEEEIEIANSEIKRIRNISKDFLKFSDLELIQLELFDIKNVVIQSVNHFKAFFNSHLLIKYILPDHLPNVFLDKRQIELLIHILIENAIDALSGEGKILIKIELLNSFMDLEKQHVKIVIADNGCGISEEHKTKIFLPNFSLKNEGSGMGLVFAKQIVQQHHGHITLSSLTEYKTAFEIILPIKTEKNIN